MLRRPVSMAADAVFDKLVRGGRGGYCFEQNTLLAGALTALGFGATPLLCRVRWGKAADQPTTYTHMALRVTLGAGCGGPDGEGGQGGEGEGAAFLVDVGFGGVGPLAPLRLDGAAGAPQEPLAGDGRYRLSAPCEPFPGAGGGYTLAQWEVKPDDWRSLYAFREARGPIERWRRFALNEGADMPYRRHVPREACEKKG